MLLSPRAASTLLSICGIVRHRECVATGEGFPIAFIKGLLPGKGARGPTKCLRLHIPCAPLCFAELLLILPERRTRGYKDLDSKWLRSTVALSRTWTLQAGLHFSSLRGSQHRHLRGKGPGIPWVAVSGRNPVVPALTELNCGLFASQLAILLATKEQHDAA